MCAWLMAVASVWWLWSLAFSSRLLLSFLALHFFARQARAAAVRKSRGASADSVNGEPFSPFLSFLLVLRGTRFYSQASRTAPSGLPFLSFPTAHSSVTGCGYGCSAIESCSSPSSSSSSPWSWAADFEIEPETDTAASPLRYWITHRPPARGREAWPHHHQP